MPDDPLDLLFPPEAIPHVATPVSEHSVEWAQLCLLRRVEEIRFDPERCALYAAACGEKLPPGFAAEFLDFILEQLGGRSQ